MSADVKYCYPNSNVLINKANIKDAQALSTFEREESGVRMMEIRSLPVKGNLDYKHLQGIHKALFQNIYEWAGKQRTVDIAKGDMFCRVPFLQEYSDNIFGRLKKDGYLLQAPKAEAIEKLAHYLGDINALHPFREGNGRTQRQFIEYAAKTAGIDLDWSKANAPEMMEASVKSFRCDFSQFESIFARIATPLSREEQRGFIASMSKDLLKTFDGLEKAGQLPDRVREFHEASESHTATAPGKAASLSPADWKAAMSAEREKTGKNESPERRPYTRSEPGER